MKIIWGVDPAVGLQHFEASYRTLSALGCGGAKTTAIFVLSPEARARRVLGAKALSEHLDEAELLLKKKLRQAHASVEAKVLFEPGASQTAVADRLIDAAISAHADTLAVYKHTRGLRRLYLGSFTETVLHRSPLPVLVMNPGTEAPRKMRRILFATDLTVRAKHAYAQLLSMAKACRAAVTVFHAADPFLIRGANPGRYIDRLNRQLATYVDMGEAAGIEVQTVTDSHFSGVEELVLRHAASLRADLVVVAAQKRLLSGMLLGSVTRRLVRDSRTPVLVMKT